ncbi:pirin family protein [Pseudoalteromonas gelatinilytica]
MKYIRKSEDRGKANLGWLDSKHSFSFGRYFDPKHMGLSVLRVINDDTVKPGAGFGTHGHRDMEIISYVIKGALKHKDSTGNEYIVPAGEVQRMSAGRGVMHSEFNASNSEEVKFLQIWIQPDVKGIEPSYEQKAVLRKGELTPIVTPNGMDGSLSMNQDASIYRLELESGKNFTLETESRVGYLHIIQGELVIDEQSYAAGDAFALSKNEKENLIALTDIEALWFDLPL